MKNKIKLTFFISSLLIVALYLPAYSYARSSVELVPRDIPINKFGRPDYIKTDSPYYKWVKSVYQYGIVVNNKTETGHGSGTIIGINTNGSVLGLTASHVARVLPKDFSSIGFLGIFNTELNFGGLIDGWSPHQGSYQRIALARLYTPPVKLNIDWDESYKKLKPIWDFTFFNISEADIKKEWKGYQLSNRFKIKEYRSPPKGDPLLIIGFPIGTAGGRPVPVPSFAVRKVVPKPKELQGSGNEHSKELSAPDVEDKILFLDSKTASSMSGGGVFDRFGNFVGMLVRSRVIIKADWLAHQLIKSSKERFSGKELLKTQSHFDFLIKK